MEPWIGYLTALLVAGGSAAYWVAGKLARYQERQLERILQRYIRKSSSSGLDIVLIGDSTHIQVRPSSRQFVLSTEGDVDALQE